MKSINKAEFIISIHGIHNGCTYAWDKCMMNPLHIVGEKKWRFNMAVYLWISRWRDQLNFGD